MKDDAVNHPSHYTDGNIEVINFIEDKKLDFHLGNAVKYISRAGKKDPTKELEDLQKAQWYLQRKIDSLNGLLDETIKSAPLLLKENKILKSAMNLAVQHIEDGFPKTGLIILVKAIQK
jgi:peptidoglycan hydrolase CwlO-like protein